MFSVDTNVLVYAADRTDEKKHLKALKLVDQASRESWPISAQVYGEFFNVATRRGHVSRERAAEILGVWKGLMPPLVSSLTAHEKALELAANHQMQYWDALIIATCAEHGVTQLYTEDVPGKARPLGVRCVNPFK